MEEGEVSKKVTDTCVKMYTYRGIREGQPAEWTEGKAIYYVWSCRKDYFKQWKKENVKHNYFM